MPREYTIKHYLEKAAAYCAYQERSESDVLKRLQKWDLKPSEIEKIQEKLRREGFVNDVRFSEAYVRGKHRQNKWGRFRIRQGLLAHGIDQETASSALYSIPEDQYFETLQGLLQGKLRIENLDSIQEKARVFNYLRGKGYEYDLIQQAWENVSE